MNKLVVCFTSFIGMTKREWSYVCFQTEELEEVK